MEKMESGYVRVDKSTVFLTPLWLTFRKLNAKLPQKLFQTDNTLADGFVAILIVLLFRAVANQLGNRQPLLTVDPQL